MRILIITQNEPFYLVRSIDYLLTILPSRVEDVSIICNSVSPFGKTESFFKKSLKTLKIFGAKFFIYYSTKFILSKLFSKSIVSLAKEKNIEIIELNDSINSKDSLSKISSYSPDLIISILGNQIFKKPLLELPPLGCINLHTALLPKYRGLMPTFWVLKNDEKYTGVSVFFIDEGIDSGPIIVQKKIEIGDKSQSELIKLTKKIGMEAIAEAIDLILKENINLIKNNETDKSYFSFPTKKDVKEFKLKGKKFF